MTTQIITILILSLVIFVGQLGGQISNSSIRRSVDTLKTAREKEIIQEYFQQQQNLVLQLDDTLKKAKETTVRNNELNENFKFIILCFNLSKSYAEEIAALNKIAKEYEKNLSSIVINADDLNKYKELFTRKEFKSLQDFISNKSESQKRSTSFPVILILDKSGQILNAWSGDKTEDGLKREDYYVKIKAGLETLSKQK